MKPKVYDQFDSAFARVSTRAILWNGKHVANITVKWGGSCVAFVHWIGSEMQRGQAKGGGYDRESAAVEKAIDKIRAAPLGEYENPFDRDLESWQRFTNFDDIDGKHWHNHLRDQGFTVLNVIG